MLFLDFSGQWFLPNTSFFVAFFSGNFTQNHEVFLFLFCTMEFRNQWYVTDIKT